MKISTLNASELLGNIKRIDANYHLSPGVSAERILSTSPYQQKELKACCDRIFNGNRYKRVYVRDDRRGFVLLGISDVLKGDQSGTKCISKKFTRNFESLLVHEGWILVARSGSGAIGTAVYATEDFENKVISEDLLRIVPNKEIKSGFVYAFLASTYGYNLLQKGIYGTAIPHIEPEYVDRIKVPIFPKKLQTEIHDLIQKASTRRVESNSLLKDAHKIVLEHVRFRSSQKRYSVNLSTLISSHQSRFEAHYYLSDGYLVNEHVKKGRFTYLKDLTKSIFRPGIFKRHYVQDGIDFLGGSDIVKRIPKSDKKLSLTKTRHLKSLVVEEDWILITCGGSIGSSVLVNSFLDGKAASQHILRVVPDRLPTGYLFAYLSSPIGLKSIQSFSYGSVIPQIENHHLERLPVPLLDDEVIQKIDSLVMEYKKGIGDSINFELQAILLVEKEIRSWQK